MNLKTLRFTYRVVHRGIELLFRDKNLLSYLLRMDQKIRLCAPGPNLNVFW